ncbi:ABC transporter ATP-binding protein [Anoxynatronum buryatiense]|uniref:ATP-binding cassette, subfamily B n=1 Tax=Anoxynatronum buryatiense TaxID=489973 RepID=A0AA46AK93_9CLOT|nr:ABC transporter ATP-binding protein [Anoxynatronum buryatiense]SMP68703.1 ATP-binding cassette, subfamily B [Anoxynatronum buryatiense]
MKSSNLSFILSHAGKQKYKMYASVVFSVLTALMNLVPFILIYKILETLLGGGGQTDGVGRLVAWTALAAVLHMIFLLLSLAFSHMAAFSILHEIRVKAMDHMGKLPLGFFRKHSTGHIKKAIDEDVEKLELFIAHQIPDLAEAVVTPLLVIIYLVSLHWPMALFLLIPLIFSFLSQMLMYQGRADMMREYTTLQGKLHSTIVEYIRGIAVFKAFNLTARSFHQYTETTKKYLEFWIKCTYDTMSYYTVGLLLIDSGLIFTIPAGGILFLRGSLSGAAYVMFLLLSSVFLQSFRKLLELGMNLSMLLAGANQIRGILEAEPQRDQQQGALSELSGNVAINNLSFAYENEDVLKQVNLQIPAGSSVALVGPSGSGKTTLGLLLGRFYDAPHGAITIDGIPIDDIPVKTLMDQTAFVFQDVFMLNDTIFNNIRLGMDKTREEVEAAAQKAQIHDFIMSLENGYETVLGEGTGIKLSGGEKQRISIARVFLKDAPLVVLDEITSYSDIDNEARIQQAMQKLLENRTAIIIAHRLYTIKNVDQIVVLDHGRIIEQGTHEVLMAKRKIYHSLWYKGEGGVRSA